LPAFSIQLQGAFCLRAASAIHTHAPAPHRILLLLRPCIFLLLASCSWIPTIVTRSIDVGITIAEKRTFYNTAEDYATRSEITSSFFDENLLLEVTTDVYKGRVMLTGAVKSMAARRRAGELARQVSGTRVVFNEIRVTQEGRVQAVAEGLIIEAKLKAKLLTADGVRSINYRWRAINGVVYLLGTAGSPEELSRVMSIARKTSGVRTVISHVVAERKDAAVVAAARERIAPLRGRVVSVYDGRTITVLLGHRREKVRLIGSDPPDTAQQGKYSQELLARLVQGKTVTLETDAERRDQYKHLLAYVYVGDLLVNVELVRQGHAVMHTRRQNLRHVDKYRLAQNEAQAAGRGVWQQPIGGKLWRRMQP
jgi:osmotically-inducible protein OsmY